MRRWSSSLIITAHDWSLLITTPEPPLLWHNSRLIRWRSTRICFSCSERSEVSTARPRFICARPATACMQRPSTSRRCGSLAQPGKGWLARFRANRIRVIITTALLLAEVSVSSEGAAISSLIFISSLGFRTDGLPDLVDFIAESGRILVALRLDCLIEVGFQLGEAFVERATLQGATRNFAHMTGALVHAVENRIDHGGKGFVTDRAAKTAGFLEILLGQAARLAAKVAHRLGGERSLHQQVREGKAAGIGHAFGLGTGFAEIHLVDLVVDDLRKMHRGRLGAEVALE